jgi:NADH dehydrogenase [ubiquinone] 1 alpha subcomplex assembly factor 1
MKRTTTLWVCLLMIGLASVARAQQTVIQLADPTKDSFWFALTDAVRPDGGGSTAFMAVDWTEKKASFSGELKLDANQKGFASFRAQDVWDLTEAKTLKFKAKGDGRTYSILIKDEFAERSLQDYSYQAQFQADSAGGVKTIDIQSMVPVYRGQKMKNAPALELSKIRQIGIQINDGQNGPYQMEFGEIFAE